MFGLESWARFASRHPWHVLAGALASIAVFGVLFAIAGGGYADSFSIPGTESQRLVDLLEKRFPQSAGDSATVVVRAADGLDNAKVRSRVEALVAELKPLPEVVGVTSPYDQPGAISSDGSIALINVQYSKQAFDLKRASVNALLDLREKASTPGFQIEAGGRVVRVAEMEKPGSSELVGLTAAVIILLIAFGSVVAMGLPIITALLALASGFFLVGVGASFVDLASFTPQFAGMIGIGVGIDYSLLVVTRFREGLAQGVSVEDAIAKASTTAGRSVAFAGTTVVIALLGLWAMGLPFIAYVATAAALVVALSVVVAVVVLPAILRLAGPRIDKWRLPGLAAVSYDSETGFGYRLSRIVQRAPLASLAVSLGILLALASPVLGMRLGASDAGNSPKSFTSRRAYDLISEGFGPGYNGRILVALRIDDPGAMGAIDALPSVIAETEGVASVSPPTYNEADSAAIITVIPATAPQSQETADLVHHLRRRVPEAVEGSGAQALVGGPTAVFIDVGDRITSRLPPFFAAVIGLSFVLLMAVFRSVLVPLKAAAMNLLSIGAAYGVLVAVFQWGWFGGIIGVQRQGPIESFLPMMMFAVLFGLSMDYEVFLVSRIREEFLETRNNTESVARGLSMTTRVISAAAAIMVAVFLSFALSDQRVVKEFGIGLAAAIFIDATVVRLILVPSIMQLLGNANWWFPRWLDRLMPQIGFHAPEPVAELSQPKAAVASRQAARPAATGNPGDKERR